MLSPQLTLNLDHVPTDRKVNSGELPSSGTNRQRPHTSEGCAVGRAVR